MRNTLFTISARLYEDLHAAQKRDDIFFYIALAQEVGSPILELGCGSGRISLPLAKAGFSVTGLDISEEMIDYFQEKMRRESEEVQTRISLCRESMDNFEFDQKFSLIIVAYNSFLYLDSLASKLRTLKCMAKHLKDGGCIVLDIAPEEYWKKLQPGSSTPLREVYYSPLRAKIQYFSIILSNDILHRRLHSKEVFRIQRGSALAKEEEIIGELVTYYTTLEEMKDLLRKAGFSEICILGNYDGSPWQNGWQQFVAWKKFSYREKKILKKLPQRIKSLRKLL